MNAIQPCALLLLVGPDWQLEAISANAALLGDVTPSALIGQPLTELIGSKAIHNLRNRMSWLSNDESDVQDFGVEWGGALLDIRASRDEDHYVIEAELAVEPRLPDGIGMVRSMTDRLSGRDPNAQAEQAMRQLCALTGFDRLGLYDRNGAVIATAGRQLRPFDSEPVAISGPQIIADRDGEPIPLLGDCPQKMMDHAAFAAPSDERRTTLEAQGVMASMALPLRIDGELVATLHAHHPGPRRSGAERRSVAHLFAERLVARMTRFGWQP